MLDTGDLGKEQITDELCAGVGDSVEGMHAAVGRKDRLGIQIIQAVLHRAEPERAVALPVQPLKVGSVAVDDIGRNDAVLLAACHHVFVEVFAAVAALV